jgi:hypothetical protein
MGLDYENKIIPSTIEVVKQVTVNYNADKLIPKKIIWVKSDVEIKIISV